MDITRRDLTIGGMSLLAGASMSTLSRAELGDFLGFGEGPPMPTCTAIRS